MKERTKGFLQKYFQEPQPDTELAEYIQEIHSYLWRFVRAEFPFAQGDLKDYIKIAIEHSEYRNNKSKYE